MSAIKARKLIVLVLMGMASATTTNVAPGDDTLVTAVGNAASGTVLQLTPGFYNLLTTGHYCVTITNPLTILGV